MIRDLNEAHKGSRSVSQVFGELAGLIHSKQRSWAFQKDNTGTDLHFVQFGCRFDLEKAIGCGIDIAQGGSMPERDKMAQFWKKKRLVLFGFSRNPGRVSRQVYDLLISRGYEIYPINPNTNQIGSIPCYRSLEEIHHDVEGAIVITNPTISLEIVKQCHHRGITDFWFQLNTMDEAVRDYLHTHRLHYAYDCILMSPHLLQNHRSSDSTERS